jgi:hypothetical protein
LYDREFKERVKDRQVVLNCFGGGFGLRWKD